MALTWSLTVPAPRWMRAPMSAFDSPSATRTRTSRSRAVRSRTRAASASTADEVPGWLCSSVREALGESTTPPAARVRTRWASCSGSVSLSRKPAAPECSAVRMYSSASNVVSIATTGASGIVRSSRRTVSPSTSGIRMSSSTTSGRSRRTVSTASPPLAVATTSMSSEAPRMSPNPDRTSASSSTTTTRITCAPPHLRPCRPPPAESTLKPPRSPDGPVSGSSSHPAGYHPPVGRGVAAFCRILHDRPGLQPEGHDTARGLPTGRRTIP